ncbi:serine/threonine protein kinase [bacterium]|nr:MAG: serine/threonine protein kinase [bacterium]
MIGSTIGSYRITGQLGEGGMGAVYRATDNIEREVAIKALHSQLTRDESRLQRFRSEAIALGRLHHPNIASLYHLHEQDGNYYMVMEYVQGETLEDIVRSKGAMPPEMALAVFIDGLKGFEHAHTRGVIHRDIKPSNIMVSSEGVTKITDFGIARMAGSGRMTQTGKVIGTLEYMSPEQVRGLEQDARSDIYSLGILLFELLTGRMPFTATSDYEIMRAHLEVVPPPARSIVATLPAGLDAIIAKALAKDPVARFQSVAEMRLALEAIARQLPAPPPTQTLLYRPEPAPGATRQVVPPTSLPATGLGEVQPLPPTGNNRTSYPPNVVPPSDRNQRHVPTPTPMPKWALPASLGLVAVLLVGGAFAFKGRGGGDVTPTAEPTPIATQLATVDNTPTSNGSSPVGSEITNTASGSSIGELNNVATNVRNLSETPVAPQPTADIDIPDSIPGFSDPTPIPVRPTAVPTSPPPRVVTPPRPRVVEKPPAPRKRVVTTPPRPRKPRVRTVERPRVRPRVVERPRPRPRVVSRPAAKRRPSGGGEEAALRAIIKGG